MHNELNNANVDDTVIDERVVGGGLPQLHRQRVRASGVAGLSQVCCDHLIIGLSGILLYAQKVLPFFIP